MRVVVIFFLITKIALAADPNYCAARKLGWHFYCDPKKSEEIKASERPQTIEEVREALEATKARAVLNPTEENVKTYIELQNQQIKRAEKFSQVWQKVLWKHPELDFSVKAPSSTVGNEVTAALHEEQVKQALSKLSERYGIFFFYSSKCSFCHKYSPILRVFAQAYKLNVIAVSLDGGVIKDWPNTVINNGQAETMGLADKPVPATILFDNKTQSIVPVGFGLLSVTDLGERIYELTEHKK